VLQSTALSAAALPLGTRRLLRSWERRWRVPGLVDSLKMQFSDRLRSTLGRSEPRTGRVLLHASLRGAPEPLLREVLCHEVAHVAAYRLYGKGLRAHGEEWKTLVALAGYRPTLYHQMSIGRRSTRRSATFAVLHTCPVCQTRRFARRAIPRWRCAECTAAGLDGRLEITRVIAAK
jgi:SprT protein